MSEEKIEKWYIFRVQSGKEDFMIDNLKKSITSFKGYKKYFIDFSLPKRTIAKYVNNKKVVKEVCAYPGYLFIKLNLTDEVVLFLRRFFQNNGYGQMLPQPITDDEYKKMIDTINGISNKNKDVVFRIGQRVKINNGSFASMEGNITALNDKECKMTVAVMIFNCETKVEVEYEQVTPLD